MLLFAVLLALRLDPIPRDDRIPQAEPRPAAAEEGWMSIYQGGAKIGFSHRRFQPAPHGFRLSEETFMRINAMGSVQDVRMHTSGDLRRDMSLAAFDFRLESDMFAFQAHGTIEAGILRVTVGPQTSEIPLDGPVYLASGILHGMRFSGPRTFPVFDPTTLSRRPVTVTPVADETIEVMGRPTPAQKLRIEFAGATGLAWMDAQGRVVREKGLMGIELHRTTRQEALADLDAAPAADLTGLAAVAIKTPIEAPEMLARLRLRISGLEDPARLDGGRQQYAGGLLTIERESLPDPPVLDITGQKSHLQASVLIQSDAPKIRQTAQAIVADAQRPGQKVQRLVAWVHANLKKRPVVSIPNALEVLERRMGDCNEHAVLLAALARAAGIPTRVEAGLVYQHGAFYYHAWNSVWLNRWVTVDAVMNQIPADATHIRLAGGEPDQAVDLMGMIGKIRLEVIER